VAIRTTYRNEKARGSTLSAWMEVLILVSQPTLRTDGILHPTSRLVLQMQRCWMRKRQATSYCHVVPAFSASMFECFHIPYTLCEVFAWLFKVCTAQGRVTHPSADGTPSILWSLKCHRVDGPPLVHTLGQVLSQANSLPLSIPVFAIYRMFHDFRA